MKHFRIFLALALLCMVTVARATVTSQVNRAGPYTCTGLPATLAVQFSFQAASDILVLNLGQSGTGNDPAVVLTLNSDYTVTGGGYSGTNAMLSGNVVVNSGGAHTVQVGDVIVILRNVPVNQTSSLTTGVPTAAAIERALDKQATLSQQLTETTTRGLRFEPGETIDGTLLRSARANNLLGFDSSGNIAYYAPGSGGGGGGTTYTAGTGLNLSSNQFSVKDAQTFTSLTVTNPIVGGVTGNAATATALQIPRTINGVAFDGTANVTVSASASTLTGTTLAANVVNSSLTTVGVGTLGTMATQAANNVNITGGLINGPTITGVATPVNPTDVANKNYVDTFSAGITPRTGVKVASTANIAALSGTMTIDGVAVIAGDRVLVKNQSSSADNGIYDVAAGAWSRSSDSNTAGELLRGYYYFVSQGTTQAATGWFIQTAPTVLGVDPVVFSQFSASSAYTAGTGLSLVGNQFSLNAAQSSLTITGSTLNSSPIGGTSPSTGVFTTASASTSIGYVNGGTQWLIGNGGFNGPVGAGTPAAGSFTTLSGSVTATGTSASRTLADRFATVINLKDFGAVGNGVADDNLAITNWLAAATSRSVLYAPAGKYRFTGGNFTLPSGITQVTFCGDGWSTEFYNDTGSSGLNSFSIPRTTTFVTIRDCAFTGTSSVRANGIHWRVNGSYTQISRCYFSGCSDFAVLFSYDTNGWSSYHKFVGNTVYRPLGDGVHVGQATDVLIADNTFIQTGDDGIGIVADSTTYVPNRITVVANHIYDAGGIGVSGSAIRVEEATDVLVEANQVYGTKEGGIMLDRYLSTTNYNNRVKVKGNKIQAANSLGGSGGIMAHFTYNCEIADNSIDELAGGNGISVLDAQELLIQNNEFRNVPSAIYVQTDTTNVAVAWDGLTIKGNTVKYATNGGASAFQVSPGVGITINDLIIDGNVARTLVGGLVYYDKINNGRITNNTSFGGSISAGGSVVGVTTANNN